MNLHHYQVSRDYEHGCHFSGLPTLFISGYRQTIRAKDLHRADRRQIACLTQPHALN